MELRQTKEKKPLYNPDMLAVETYIPLHWEGITFFCGKKNCCRKYKKRGKKRCKKCPDVN